MQNESRFSMSPSIESQADELFRTGDGSNIIYRGQIDKNDYESPLTYVSQPTSIEEFLSDEALAWSSDFVAIKMKEVVKQLNDEGFWSKETSISKTSSTESLMKEDLFDGKCKKGEDYDQTHRKLGSDSGNNSQLQKYWKINEETKTAQNSGNFKEMEEMKQALMHLKNLVI